MATKKPEPQVLEVMELRIGTYQVGIIGESPLLCNKVSEKARRELLLPPKQKSKAEKSVTLKHRPYDEFRNSIHTDKMYPETAVLFPSSGFKGALANAALDIPGAAKTQIGRLTWVPGTYVPIYGIPQIYMGIVRQADINRTPDVRTWAILPRWGCMLTIEYVTPNLTERAVGRLLSAAGIVCGIGDGRVQKGKLSFGRFRTVSPDDPELAEILANGGRPTQEAALETPECYDQDTADLLSWFDEESSRRELS